MGGCCSLYRLVILGFGGGGDSGQACIGWSCAWGGSCLSSFWGGDRQREQALRMQRMPDGLVTER